MDGFSSAPPSTSVASNPNHGSGMSFPYTPRPSIRELLSSMNSTSTVAIDPPRPAKEGCEWVWFPVGYWAERKIIELPPKESIRLFKWRSRPRKSGSESPKHSPQTAHSLPENRVESPTDYLAGRRSQTRTPTSSESGGYCYPSNRMPGAPLPSPYLTEEAHVQSLQWPSIEASTRHGSISGSSVIKSRATISPSPLHLSSADDDMGSDKTVEFTPKGQAVADNSAETTGTGLLSPKAADSHVVKAKKSFISWRMLSEHRQRLRRSRASSDEYSGDNMTNLQSPHPQSPAKSPLRRESSVSDKSRKSRKRRSAKLFAKARWSRKFSSSSGASTSRSTASSVHNLARSQSPLPTPGSERGETSAMSNAWASEYPGGEARRLQTPRIIQNSLDQFPRSFFSDLTPPSHRPVSRQEGRSKLDRKKPATPLSALTSDGGESSSRPRAAGGEEEEGGGDDHHHYHQKRPKEKEWWEVSVPASYSQIDQRGAFSFGLPEHLPSSPMCPANPRHTSGGTGVCVYHGRAKRSRVAGEEDSEDSEDFDDGGSDVWR
ncbi:hypothetical protein F4859DRAFT_134524 [Xylaria cf. heliscus]|nr:hypothetical protein F4859DRAFT_134524 [Xylaria cf. heliscus]